MAGEDEAARPLAEGGEHVRLGAVGVPVHPRRRAMRLEMGAGPVDAAEVRVPADRVEGEDARDGLHRARIGGEAGGIGGHGCTRSSDPFRTPRLRGVDASCPNCIRYPICRSSSDGHGPQALSERRQPDPADQAGQPERAHLRRSPRALAALRNRPRRPPGRHRDRHRLRHVPHAGARGPAAARQRGLPRRHHARLHGAAPVARRHQGDLRGPPPARAARRRQRRARSRRRRRAAN